MADVDYAVIGAGMMGCAAARHLAQAGLSVALIGPSEPKVPWTDHDGPFASHYDAGRITRRLSPDADWSLLAARSLARYAEIEEQSGIRFHGPVGALLAGPLEGRHAHYVLGVEAVRSSSDIPSEAFEGTALMDRFPYLSFADGVRGVYEESGAGYVDPRAFVEASIAAAVKQGARYVDEAASSLEVTAEGARLTLRGGATLTAKQAVVACGGYTQASGLLPDPIPLNVYKRTVHFYELDEAEVARLAGMPSIISFHPEAERDIYVLPPIRYPNGKVYLKVGGEPDDLPVETVEDLNDWYRTDGLPETVGFLKEEMDKLVPDLQALSEFSAPCVTSYSPTGKPLIYRQTDCVTVLTAGNGAAAKSADEIGRLGAMVAQGQSIDSEGYGTSFGPR